MVAPVQHQNLYRRGTNGSTRFWRMEQKGPEYRTVHGVVDGTPVETGWTLATPKNEGRSNATNPVQQADAEIAAEYDKKLARGYFKDKGDIDNVPFVKPMLATDFVKRRGKIPDDTDLYIQPKLDGIRCIARSNGLWTRQGKPIVSCDHVLEELSPLFESDTDLVLDGELYNHDLKDDFNTITSVVRKLKPKKEDVERAQELVQYHIYDVVDPEEVFESRYKRLIGLIGDDGDVLHRVPTQHVNTLKAVDVWYGTWLGDGYEGQMVRLNETYGIGKRSNGLMKRKEFLDGEFEVVAVHEGEGNWRGCVKRFTLRMEDGRTFGAGVRGTQAEMAKLLESGKTPTWATVRYFTLTPDGVPRFPVVTDYGFETRQD